MGAHPFAAIAKVTGQPQIFNLRAAAGSYRYNVVDMQQLSRKDAWCETIATTLTGILFNLTPNVEWNVRTLCGHQDALERYRLTAFGKQRKGPRFTQQDAAVFAAQLFQFSKFTLCEWA